VAAAASASLAALVAPSPLLLRNTTAADRRLMAHRARVTLARLQAQADGTAPRPGEPFRWNSPFVKKEKRLKMVMATSMRKWTLRIRLAIGLLCSHSFIQFLSTLFLRIFVSSTDVDQSSICVSRSIAPLGRVDDPALVAATAPRSATEA